MIREKDIFKNNLIDEIRVKKAFYQLSDTEIGEILGYCRHTVRAHLKNPDVMSLEEFMKLIALLKLDAHIVTEYLYRRKL